MTTNALSHGHLDCVKFLRQDGDIWNESTSEFASLHLDCLRYLHENGCPWNATVCKVASNRGRLECLRYAHEHGCPWHEETIPTALRTVRPEDLRYASQEGRRDCVLYAVDAGCPVPDLTGIDVNELVIPGLYHRGIPLGERNGSAVRDHIRRHVSLGWTLIRCAVRLLGAYSGACTRVYAPGAVGFLEAEASFSRGILVQSIGYIQG